MSHIFDQSFQSCASEPTRVYLRPCEIQIQFEELSLQSMEEEDSDPMQGLQRKSTTDQESSEIDEQEESTPKRSYSQYCFGKEQKEQHKIFSSLSRFNESKHNAVCRPRKRINA